MNIENDILNHYSQLKNENKDSFNEFPNNNINNVNSLKDVQNGFTPNKINFHENKNNEIENNLNGKFFKYLLIFFLNHLGKKRNRDRQERISHRSDLENNKSKEDSGEKEKGADVEVKLICDLPNEDMKKSFTKSV